MTVYRICLSQYPANDGTGASLYGGRWNHKGISMIYTSESRALGALEVLAGKHVLPVGYVVSEIKIPDDVPAITWRADQLPPGWNAVPATNVSRDLGTEWFRSRQSAVLCVPSGRTLRRTQLSAQS